jgi:hypothetical protein
MMLVGVLAVACGQEQGQQPAQEELAGVEAEVVETELALSSGETALPSALRSTWRDFRFTLAEGAEATISLHGGQGNPDLYLMRDEVPSDLGYELRSVNGAGKTDTVVVTEPGNWYVSVLAAEAYSGYSISFTKGGSGVSEGSTSAPLTSGTPVRVSVARGAWKYFRFQPFNFTMTVTMSSGTGNCDVYLREGKAAPTLTLHDGASRGPTNSERVTLPDAALETLIGVYGTTGCSQAVLTARSPTL